MSEEVQFTSAYSDEDTHAAIERLKEDGLQVALSPDDNPDPDEDNVLTVQEAVDLLTKVAELSGEDVEKLHKTAKWAKSGNGYTLIGDTVESMPPGFYDTEVMNGSLYFVPVSRRRDKIIRFPHAKTDKVLDSIERFWDRESVFKEFNIPFKRGILMYGPPGSGKTSALQLIARDVVEKLGGIVLMFDMETFMSAYRHIRRAQPDTPLVVMMEDLDAILERRESTVLNMLDGAESMHKVVFVATTNYPENLGERIINRPSRFDMRVFVDHPNDVGRKMYLESLAEGRDVDIDYDKYVRDTKGMSMAHLKELFVATVIIGLDYKEALKDLTEMNIEKPHSASDNETFRPVNKGQYV